MRFFLFFGLFFIIKKLFVRWLLIFFCTVHGRALVSLLRYTCRRVVRPVVRIVPRRTTGPSPSLRVCRVVCGPLYRRDSVTVFFQSQKKEKPLRLRYPIVAVARASHSARRLPRLSLYLSLPRLDSTQLDSIAPAPRALPSLHLRRSTCCRCRG